MGKLHSRQIHLDFHTSEYIDKVGVNFNKENFQQALKLGHVNSITVFAKCHHSWCYYPTKVGNMHPTLNFDLTGKMIDAAHEIGVNAPVYITVGWSANDAENYPQCVVHDIDGKMIGTLYDFDAAPNDKKTLNAWKEMCPNGEYAEHIYALTREICERYSELDGLFYDINYHDHLCYCDACLKGMRDEGFNFKNEIDARKYFTLKWKRFSQNCKNILREKHKDATIFFNGGAKITEPQWYEFQSHFEIEDLPTSSGGYDKMPLRAKFFAKNGKEYLGMSGKFHTFWGEFGGYKSFNAMKYECAAMSAFGARCSMGDQLHPSGEMDIETYRLIGEGYGYVEKIEPWCYDVKETSKLGIIISKNEKADEGLVKILLEAHYDFDVVGEDESLSNFDTIILPDCVYLDDDTAAKINEFVSNGGNLLLTGKSGLSKNEKRFDIDVGANYMGPSMCDVDYLMVGDKLSDKLVNSPFLCYMAAEKICVTDAEILSTIREPYFNRTQRQYCSHQYTPYKLEDTESPGAIKKGRIVYLAHQICTQYYLKGAKLHREYLINALKLIYKNPVLTVENLPSCGRVHLVNQEIQNRMILHLLYAPPILRGDTLVIEDLPIVYNVKARINTVRKVTNAYLAPQMKPLEFIQQDGYVEITVPELKCHQIIVLDYKEGEVKWEK